jgi:hypothetical protein
MGSSLLLTFGLVFVVNLMPAFGPPTWIVLAFLKIRYDVPSVPLVVVGASASAAGRYTLARGAHAFRRYLPQAKREGLELLGRRLEAEPALSAGMLGTFLLSPLPSAQLFIAAGLAEVRLGRLTAVFFAGRLVTYSIYVAGTVVAVDQFGDVLQRGLYSPYGIALQLLMVAGLVAMVRIDWPAAFERFDAWRRRRKGDPPAPAVP